jgi:DNA-binding NtrC family response regulator
MAKILCVDDDLPFVTLERSVLEAAGYAVTIATSAREAIEKLQNEAFDLVVTGPDGIWETRMDMAWSRPPGTGATA